MGRRVAGMMYGARIESDPRVVPRSERGRVPPDDFDWPGWWRQVHEDRRAPEEQFGEGPIPALEVSQYGLDPTVLGFWVVRDLSRVQSSLADLEKCGTDAKNTWSRLVDLALADGLVPPMNPSMWITPGEE